MTGLTCTCGWYSTRIDWAAAKRHVVNAPGGIHEVTRATDTDNAGYFCGSNYCDDPACEGEHYERL